MKKRLLYLIYSLLFFLPAIGLAQTNHVVISEVYGGGGNSLATYTNDFVELYNPTNSSIDLTNWSIQYASAAGTSWAFQTLTGSIKSHGFYLIQLAAGTSVTNKPLPVTADASSSTINLSASTGKIALVSNSTALSGATPSGGGIVDLFGYYFSGTTPTAFETAYYTITPAPSNVNAVSFERKANSSSTTATLTSGGTDELAGNGYDSDNNSTDFVVQSVPNPQNTSSAIEPVATPTLTATPTPLDFGTATTIGGSSTKTFSVTGSNLTANVALATAAPYSLSTDGGTTYNTTGTVLATALATGAQTVIVKFTPTLTTATPGTVTVNSTGAAQQTVNLTGTGAAAVPTLTATPTSLAFGNVNAGLTSVKTYALSGTNLTANATVNATAPYTVSSDGSTYGATATFTAAAILANTATVSVKFSPASAGAANSSITTTDGEVASPPTVTVTGTGVIPVLTATTSPATTPTSIDFGNQQVLTSAFKTYSLSGVNLTGNTTVAVTGTGYTISKDGVTYATTGLTYTSAELTAATAPLVYVKFAPGASLGALPGSVTNTTTGSGAAVLTVNLTGTGVAAPVPFLTVTPTSLTGFSTFVGQPSAAQTYSLSGGNLSGNTTVTVTAPYSVSKTAGGTYGTSLTYTTLELVTAQTVYVVFNPSVVGTGGVNNSSAINATSGTTNTQSVTLSGTGVGVPLLTPSVNSLTFSTINGTKSVQNFQLSGAYITAPTTLNATGAYLLSKDNTTFSASLNYTVADMATNQTVYVQFTAPALVGASNGSIAITSTGANSPTVALNGTSLATPVLTVSPGTLTFTLPSSTTAVVSAPQTFLLTAGNVIANTTVTTSGAYLLSKDGTTYSSSLTYTTAELANPQTVYVTFSITSASVVGSTTGSIVVASTGATNATVSLTGNVSNTAPTLAAIADQTVCYTTTQQVVPLTGITAGVETYQGVVVSVTSSNPALFSSIGVLPLTAGTPASLFSGSLLYSIANGQSGTAVITVTVKDNGGTAAGGVDTYTRTFNITVNPLPVITITIDQANNIVEKGSTATLTAIGGGAGATYTWSSTVPANIISSLNNASITIRPSVFSNYTVTVTNACLTTTVTKVFGVEVSTAFKLETSNVITPNGDGRNDVWVVRNIDLYPGNNVKVFDKTGKLVFSKTGYNNDWNGYYNGSPLPQGSYIYVVDLGQGIPYRGVISVVRD